MKNSFETWLPKLVVTPAFVLGFAFIYGLMVWNGVLSLTSSRMLPNYEWAGIALDQKIRAEGALRSIYLYPMALSFIVTGTAWKWLLNPGLGIEKMVRDWGFAGFSFDWLVDTDKAIYCVVIAGIWQSAGFAMALFLAGLRGIDDSIIKAAQVDGASLPRIYWRIVLPAFMYTMAFSRGQIGLGAASATMMLATVAALVIPYLYSELRNKPHDR